MLQHCLSYTPCHSPINTTICKQAKVRHAGHPPAEVT